MYILLRLGPCTYTILESVRCVKPYHLRNVLTRLTRAFVRHPRATGDDPKIRERDAVSVTLLPFKGLTTRVF